ncbi:hypothetical protein XthCFBP4691_04140 [Xanthomonas theicola]|uniref:DUF2946 domain-containing protein n=2 Tax=Xanthomonas theicola TaxID=56464 RepID=A0A2S6ZJW4_9XANT|nr:hypothetical protein XthCFBP4691_04140 [Xanthomonas theicola]QNH27045.1 DUF2946 domain-containing protein [Xanthomonas theicola]
MPLWEALAVLAMALMLAAPLLSRWQQARSGDRAAAAGPLCSSRGLQSLPPLPVVPVPVHPGTHDGAGLPHAPACDYCLLAARLLPVLALVLVVLRWLRHPAPRAAPRPPAAQRGMWRAHAARGPPLRS